MRNLVFSLSLVLLVFPSTSKNRLEGKVSRVTSSVKKHALVDASKRI
jgi:hypothetical protein